MERDKALDMALKQIEKAHGAGAVMRLGERGSMAIESIPTGALALDVALGIGGIPYNVVQATYKALMTHESIEDISLKLGKRLMSLDKAKRLQI